MIFRLVSYHQKPAVFFCFGSEPRFWCVFGSTGVSHCTVKLLTSWPGGTCFTSGDRWGVEGRPNMRRYTQVPKGLWFIYPVIQVDLRKGLKNKKQDFGGFVWRFFFRQYSFGIISCLFFFFSMLFNCCLFLHPPKNHIIYMSNSQNNSKADISGWFVYGTWFMKWRQRSGVAPDTGVTATIR